MTVKLIKPLAPVVVRKTDGRVRLAGGPALRGLPGAQGTPGENGTYANGAYSAGDAIALPTLTDLHPVQIGGFSRRAYVSDAAPFNLSNALQDGGRFAGVPEVNGVTIGAYVAPTYLTAYNGAVFTAGPKFIHNNTTYGGTSGALDADVNELVQLMKPGSTDTAKRYGPEFYTINITCGSGTGFELNVGGVLHYLVYINPTFPVPSAYMGHLWFKVVSGSIAAYPTNGMNARKFVDGAEVTGAIPAFGPGSWHRLGSYFIAGVDDLGYSNTALSLWATPGSVLKIAAPVFFTGHAYKGGIIGLVPSAGAIR